MFLYTISGPPANFRQGFERCQRCATSLPRKDHPEANVERQRLAHETVVGEEADEAPAEEDDLDDEEDENLDPWDDGADPWTIGEGDDPAMRMNDFRQASGGLRRPKARAKAKPKVASAPSRAPVCRVCGGRHRVWPCPNVVAKKDANFKPETATSSGAKCFFSGSSVPE